MTFIGCAKPPPPAPPTPATEVSIVETKPADTPIVFEFVGKTASSRRVEIRSRVQGFLEKRLYTEGSMVSEGDVLFQMDRKPFEAQLRASKAELSQQAARLETAKAHLERVEPLAKQNAVAQKELDDALGTYRSSAAAVEAAKAKVEQAELDLSYTTIKAPVTGLSSFAVQHEGAYIGFGAESLLTYVARLDPIWVEFSISENQLLKMREQVQKGLISPPEDGNYEVWIVLADGTVYPHHGRLTFADASLSEETGTFLIRAELNNPSEDLRPGQFVRVRLKGAYRPDAILLPQRAVQQGAQGSFVWLVDDEGKAEFRPIVEGAWLDDQWFVNEGLEGDERVVVDGAVKLRAHAPVKIVPSDDADSGGSTDATDRRSAGS